MTTSTTIDHAGLIVAGEQWLKQRGIHQTLTEAQAKTACDGEPLCQIPDVYGYGVVDDEVNGKICSVVETFEIDAKTTWSDAKANSNKPHQVHIGWGVGRYRYFICEPHVIETYQAEERGRGLLWVMPNGEVYDQFADDRTHYTYHQRNHDAEAYLNWIAWRSHELHDRAMTAQAKRKAMNGGGAGFPDKLTDAIQNTLSVYGPLRFADIWKLCDELRMHAAFGGKRHKAQKALDDALDQGRIKGFGVVPNVTPTVYTVEMNS